MRGFVASAHASRLASVMSPARTCNYHEKIKRQSNLHFIAVTVRKWPIDCLIQADRLTQVFPTKIVTFTEDNRLSPQSLYYDLSVSVKALEVINWFQSLKISKLYSSRTRLETVKSKGSY